MASLSKYKWLLVIKYLPDDAPEETSTWHQHRIGINKFSWSDFKRGINKFEMEFMVDVRLYSDENLYRSQFS